MGIPASPVVTPTFLAASVAPVFRPLNVVSGGGYFRSPLFWQLCTAFAGVVSLWNNGRVT